MSAYQPLFQPAIMPIRQGLLSLRDAFQKNKPKWIKSRESRSDSRYVIGMLADRYLGDQ